MRWWSEVILNGRPLPKVGEILKWRTTSETPLDCEAKVLTVDTGGLDPSLIDRAWVRLEGNLATDFISLEGAK